MEFLLRQGYPGHISFEGDLHGFPQLIMHLFLNNEWKEWTKDCYFLILTGTPCQSISRGARLTGRRKFGLHVMPSKLWHVAYAGIYHIQILIGIARLITFSENVIPGNAADLKELDEQSGFRYKMDSTPNEGIARQRYLWSNRKIPFVIKLPRDMTTDRSEMPPRYTFATPLGLKGIPALRACFPNLFWEYVFDPKTMSRQDNITMEACKVIKSKYSDTEYYKDDHGKRLPPLFLWAQWMGLDEVSIDILLDNTKCSHLVQVNRRDQPTHKELCGINGYCHGCSETLHALGEAWNLQTTTRFLATILLGVVKNVSAGQFNYTIPPHICTEDCPKTRNHF